MPIEGPFESLFENERARIGKVEQSDGRVNIEVMILLLPPFSTVRYQDLRRSSEVVERLEGLGITLQYLEGGWGVGELTVNAEVSLSTVLILMSVLRSFG